MPVIAVGSLKGSPGVTTVAVALAGCWPHRDSTSVVLVEADPAGGDLAARFGHPDSPGLTTLASAARHGHLVVDRASHLQRSGALGVDVVLAPAGEAARAAVAVLAYRPRLLGELADVVVADVGRLTVDAPVLPIVAAADVLVLLAPPRLDALAHVAARLPAIRAAGVDVVLALAGDGPFRPAEITRDLGVAVVGRLPEDRRGAGLLGGVLAGGRGWRRLPLPRAAAGLAATVGDRVRQVSSRSNTRLATPPSPASPQSPGWPSSPVPPSTTPPSAVPSASLPPSPRPAAPPAPSWSVVSPVDGQWAGGRR